MFNRSAEISVGVFIIAGVAGLVYLAVSLGNVGLLGASTYTIEANFDSVTGLRKGASVEVAGVAVGKVSDIKLDTDTAVVSLSIDRGTEIPDDTIASIRTKGIIGEKFIKLTYGGSDTFLDNGGALTETESSISIEELVSKYIFEKK